MRGSLDIAFDADELRGIIPAHAGLTTLSPACARPHGDHPRACGAHCSYGDRRRVARGSSPRMRGSHTTAEDHIMDAGIIPAHAGLTIFMLALANTYGDHPRACGAHLMALRPSFTPLGSSPRMRGSRSSTCTMTRLIGIIPAHAGLTTRTSSRHAREVGSSPRMRGSRLRAHNRYRQLGIIPAHAGLTTPSLMTRRSPWDHPRACGAHQQST